MDLEHYPEVITAINMDLEHLPEELLILIIKLLDLKSIRNLYDAGIPHVQNVIGSGFIKKCDLSCSILASKNTFNTQFFLDISANLLELNLGGVQDLTIKDLLPTIRRMKYLSTLNVAYTNITIFDFIDIYDHCPCIKNISIDYQFTDNKDAHFSQERLSKCQEVFANMETVHFVGSPDNLLYSSLPQIILQKANLTRLTYTLAKHSDMMTYYKYSPCDPFSHNNLNIFRVAWRYSHSQFTTPDTEMPVILKDLHLQYDFLQITQIHVFCSPVFQSFLKKYFNVQATVISSCLSESGIQWYHHIETAFMCWNKKTTTYDENFFKQLFLVLLPLFLLQVSYSPLKVSYSPKYSDEYMESSMSDFIYLNHVGESNYDIWNANMLQSQTNQRIMDYDKLLDKKEKVELAVLFFDLLYPISLSSNSNFLAKLTYLSLDAESTTFSPDFFNVLFQCSINLITLNIETSDNSCVSQISEHIGLSRTLKNFRLRTEGIEYHELFSVKGICVCKTLENVTIIDESSACVRNIGEPELLFTFCENLYYLCIENNMNEFIRAKKFKMLNSIKKTKGRPHVCIELIDYRGTKYTYDPFIEVFKLRRFKSLVI